MALSPDSSTLIQMIWTTDIQNCGCVLMPMSFRTLIDLRAARATWDREMLGTRCRVC